MPFDSEVTRFPRMCNFQVSHLRVSLVLAPSAFSSSLWLPICLLSCSHAMRALVLSRLDYANSLLAGCNTGDIKRLETLQNKAARIIFRVPRLESATPLLNTLHWLPVKKRIIFKTLLYVYKVLNGLAPEYLTQFISLYTVPREGLRSAKTLSAWMYLEHS